jgi:hypothetical protein
MTDAEKLEICKRLYAAEHCQIADCDKKDCFECIEKKYLELTSIKTTKSRLQE